MRLSPEKNGMNMRRTTNSMMLRKFRSLLRTALLMGACLAMLPAASAMACPMCKTATETAGNERHPGAYMASILTMLAMPSAVFTVLGVSMYRVSKRDQQLASDMNLSDRPDA